MTSRLNPYISFAGNAREAMEFYRDVFGGDECRVGLGGEAVGEVEHAGGQGIQVSSSGFGYGR